MSCVEELLSGIDGGRVLDAGCGTGRLTRLLAVNLRNVRSVLGVDINKDSLDEARRQTDDRRISYRLADIMDTPPDPPRFDTAAIGYSLHHVPDPLQVVRRLADLLVPGGALIVNEPCADSLSPSQRNFRDLHHFKAVIDRLKGVSHRETYRTDEIREIVRSSGLSLVGECLESPEDERPADERLREGKEFLDDYMGFLKGRPEYDDLAALRISLEGRMQAEGLDSPTHIFIVARKPSAGN